MDKRSHISRAKHFMSVEPVGITTLVYTRDSITYPGERNLLLGIRGLLL